MSDPTPTEPSEISQDSRDETGAPAHTSSTGATTPTEALQFLRSSLPADPGLDGQRDTAIRTLCDKFDSEVQSWIGMYLQAQKRFENVCMDLWAKVAEGASLVELVDLAGDWMDDCIDDESLAAFHKARDAAWARDQAQEATPVTDLQALRVQAARQASTGNYWAGKAP